MLWEQMYPLTRLMMMPTSSTGSPVLLLLYTASHAISAQVRSSVWSGMLGTLLGANGMCIELLQPMQMKKH